MKMFQIKIRPTEKSEMCFFTVAQFSSLATLSQDLWNTLPLASPTPLQCVVSIISFILTVSL